VPRRPSNAKLRQVAANYKRAVDSYNREVRRVNSANKRAIDSYNREVRAHNARVRANRQKLARELSRLTSRRTVTVRYAAYQTSVHTLHQSFVRLEAAVERGSPGINDDLFEMAEGEAANSVAALNALLDEPSAVTTGDAQLRETAITSELREISPDLDHRWMGALFALNPSNPDAARHFCTSAREILVTILDMKAPDHAVLAEKPNIELTDQKKVPRREKIRYCLSRSGRPVEDLTTFVDEDINNVMELFGAFNPATHGEAGRYDLAQLRALKTRVEHAIQFLHRVVTA